MSKLRAIVVDDDTNLGTTFKLVLEMSGFDVQYVNDSQLAMKKIIEVIPDIVMLDLQMPKINGLEILQSIHSEERVSHTKIIMLTANSYALHDETINDLADLVLLKPVSLDQIRDFASRLTQSK